jgi:hypothetical protein
MGREREGAVTAIALTSAKGILKKLIIILRNLNRSGKEPIFMSSYAEMSSLGPKKSLNRIKNFFLQMGQFTIVACFYVSKIRAKKQFLKNYKSLGF